MRQLSCAGLAVFLLLFGADLRGQTPPNQESFDKVAAQAQAALEADRVSQAIRLYRRATLLRPGWSEGWWHLGTLFYDQQRFPEARDAFAHFVAVEKKQPGPGYGMLGLSDFQLKRYPEALAALERGRTLGLGSNPVFVRDVLYHDGILNSLAGEPELALQRLTQLADTIAATDPETAVLNDSRLLEAFGIAALRIPKLPSDIPPEKAPLIRQVGHAQALIALQDRAAAETELKELVAVYPNQPGVHYIYGVFLLKEHPPQAVDEFRRELEVSPSNAAAHIQLALEYLRTADYQQGLKYAQQAVALAPHNFVAHVAYGRLLLELGKTAAAIPELQAAVKLAPGSPDAHFALATALEQAGRTKEAARQRAEFQRLKALADAANR